MDSRTPSSSLRLFKEVRVHLDTSLDSTVVRIPLPSSSPLGVRSRQQIRLFKSPPTYTDEDAFSKNFLASSSSLFCGRSTSYPRNIFWRVIQDEKVLELRSVDFGKSEREPHDARLVLQLQFPASIKRGGVALADAEDGHLLNVFALTRSHDVYTCTLDKEFFFNVAAISEEVGQWCKIYRPATFSMSSPHSLTCGSSTQLVISLTDGRLLQMTRGKEDTGSKWVETTYGDGQWGASLRGLVRWQGSNSVRYDGSSLEQTTPIATSLSPDRKYIFAVCVNHTLRIWNVNKAASVFTKDLLLQYREPHDIPKVMLDPSNSNLLQLFQAPSMRTGDLYYAVTFSPRDLGEFKFWGVRDPDFSEQGVRDLFPESSFKPPDPDPSLDSKAIWRVVDFKISSERFGQGSEMWIFMRSNRHHKLFRLKFDVDNLSSQWLDCWCVVADSVSNRDRAPESLDFELQDATERWLSHIFAADRYTNTILDLSIRLYSRDMPETATDTKASLPERLTSAVVSRINDQSRGADLLTYQKAAQREWSRFYQCLQDLERLQWDSLCLSYDETGGIPWIIYSGSISAVRSLSRTEVLCENSSIELGKAMHLLETPSIETEDGEEPHLPDELAILTESAATFRNTFSVRLQQKIYSKLATELWLDPSYSVPIRIQAFYDECNFMDEVSTEQFDELTNSVKAIGGFSNFDTASFQAIFETLNHDLSATPSGLGYTVQGLGLLINGARQMIVKIKNVLLDLLCLTVFTEMEVDREETPMDKFDAPEVYSTLLSLLKEYDIMFWLASNFKPDESVHFKNASRSVATGGAGGTDQMRLSSKVSILESIFARDLKPQSTDNQSQSDAITHSIQDLLKWVVGGNDPDHPVDFKDIPVYIQCDLLKDKDLDLAVDFLRYQPSTAWSTYIRGRLALLRDRPSEAATYFKKASYKLSRPTTFDYLGASNGLLTSMEAAHFGNGLPVFFTHILSLFEANSHHVHSAQFAELALQQVPQQSTNQHDTSMYTDLLTSLFHASIKVTDISTAFSALVRHPHPEESLLPALIEKLVSDSSHTQKLLSLPFPSSLHGSIDKILASANPAAAKILAAWRLHHEDFRGAAAALLPSLQQQQTSIQSGRSFARPGRAGIGQSASEKSLDETYLSVINLLACTDDGEDWVLNAPAPSIRSSSFGANGTKQKTSRKGSGRELVTMQDIRASYQRELDRRSILETGKYEFGGTYPLPLPSGAAGDAMDVS